MRACVAVLLLFLSLEASAQVAEDVTVLYTVSGVAGEFFGDSIDLVPDVDGDGAAELLAGAPFGANGGRAVLLSGRGGRQIRELRVSGARQFGWEVLAWGDELLVTAPQSGNVYLFSASTGQQLRSWSGETAADRFGERIARRGDTIVIAAPSASANGGTSGAIYAYSASSGELLYRITGDRAGDHFGSAVGFLRDGTLAVGAYTGGSHRTGAVYVYDGTTRVLAVDGEEDGATFGRHYIGPAGNDIITADIGHRDNSGRAYIVSRTSGQFVRTFSGTHTEQFLGTGVRQLADVDADGVPDLFIGAAFDNTRGALAGKAEIHSGRDFSIIRTLTGTRAGATFGARGISVGDVNGDGIGDLLVTAPTDNRNGDRAGSIHVLSGRSFRSGLPSIGFELTDGVGITRSFSLRATNFALSCDATGDGQVRIDVDGVFDHRTCRLDTALAGSYAPGSHVITATAEDPGQHAIPSIPPASVNVRIIPSVRRRAVAPR